MKTSLLIIDIQNDYFPGGKMELVRPLEAAKKAYELLQCFREHNQHHVHIQHLATRPGATLCSSISWMPILAGPSLQIQAVRSSSSRRRMGAGRGWI